MSFTRRVYIEEPSMREGLTSGHVMEREKRDKPMIYIRDVRIQSTSHVKQKPRQPGHVGAEEGGGGEEKVVHLRHGIASCSLGAQPVPHKTAGLACHVHNHHMLLTSGETNAERSPLRLA